MFFNDFKFFFPELFIVIIICFFLLYGVFNDTKNFNLITIVTYACIYSLSIFFLLLTEQPFENIEIFFSLLSFNFFKYILQVSLIFSTIIILRLIPNYFSFENYSNDSTNSKVFKYEHVLLIMFSFFGMLVTIIANDFVLMYLGFEFQSFAFYTLATSKTDFRRSTEAGLKYFILGSFSSGLLLFGISLIYFFTGLTNFYDLRCFFSLSDNIFSTIPINLALIFILIAVFFKFPVAPFHNWAPDVYQGSPSIITAFFIIVPKISVIFVLINIVYFIFYPFFFTSSVLLSFSALLSIFIGSFGAFFQVDIKRFLAYSTISHAGFMFMSLATISFQGIQISIFYLFVYIILSFIFFISFLINRFNKNGKKIKTLADLGYFTANNSTLGVFVVLYFFSIAGIPPLAGFFSKFSVFFVLFKYQMFFFLFFSFIVSVISCFYYIKIIRFLYFDNVIFARDENTISISDNNKYFQPASSWLKPVKFILSNRYLDLYFLLFILVSINIFFVFIFDYVFQFIGFVTYTFF